MNHVFNYDNKTEKKMSAKYLLAYTQTEKTQKISRERTNMTATVYIYIIKKQLKFKMSSICIYTQAESLLPSLHCGTTHFQRHFVLFF